MKRGIEMPEPILRWPGAKWRLADWIVSMLQRQQVAVVWKRFTLVQVAHWK